MSDSANTNLASAVLMFNWVEYSVFGSMLLMSLLIGVYFGYFKKQDTVDDYMLGGRSMSVLPVMLSLVYSHVSGVTLLGIPSEIYVYGTQYVSIAFCNIAILFIINYIFLPVFYELQLTSLYEYLELRFDKETRSLASLIFAISLIIFIPVVIYIPALAFNQVTGVSVHIITPIVCLICIFYTSFGGLKAVVWTDALQSFFTLGSNLFIIFLGFYKVGSVSEVFRINREGGRLELFNMDPDPFKRNSFWASSVGFIFFWMANLTVHPGAVQRFIAVPSLNKAKLVMFWSFILFFVIKGSSVVVGMLLYAHYHDCDPVATKRVRKVGQLLPYYVMEIAEEFPGLTGLFISGVLSAALSTMSAGMNTVAGTLYEDLFTYVLKGKKQSQAQQSFMIKIITVIIGLICISLVFVVERLGAIFQMAISLHGVTGGSLVGIFIMGVFFPRANPKSVKYGALTSLVAMCGLVFATQYYVAKGLLKFPGKITSVDGCPANLTATLGFNASTLVQTYKGIGSPTVADDSVPSIFKLSYLYYTMVGTMIVLLVGLPISYLSPAPDPASLDPRLFTPFIRPYLPRPEIIKPPHEEYTLVSNVEPSSKDGKENETST